MHRSDRQSTDGRAAALCTTINSQSGAAALCASAHERLNGTTVRVRSGQACRLNAAVRLCRFKLRLHTLLQQKQAQAGAEGDEVDVMAMGQDELAKMDVIGQACLRIRACTSAAVGAKLPWVLFGTVSLYVAATSAGPRTAPHLRLRNR